MKSAAFTLFLTGALALPSIYQRQYNSDLVVSNIDGWIGDINTVNEFLNLAATSLQNGGANFPDPSTALNSANNEPFRLGNLTALLATGDGNALAASDDLMVVFRGVLSELQRLIASNDDLGVAQSVVDNINNLRCNEVLPDISELWNGVVLDNDAPQPPPLTQGPDVCPAPGIAQLPFSGPGATEPQIRFDADGNLI